MLALDQSLARIEALAAEQSVADGEPPGIVTRQVHDFGRRVLAEARRRASKTDTE